MKHLSFLLLSILLSASLAHAATGNAKEDFTVAALFWTFAPLVIIAAVIFWYVRRVQVPKEKQATQHMERVAQSLERIARALERKDKDAA